MESKTSSIVRFNHRPIPILPSYRPMLRMAQILLVLKLNSKGNKASLLKLHLFSWAFKSRENMIKLERYSKGNRVEEIIFFGIEPTLNLALKYCMAEELVRSVENSYELTEKGQRFATLIVSDLDQFMFERTHLMSIGQKITESQINELKKVWNNAKD